jgi:hypothetical protein
MIRSLVLGTILGGLTAFIWSSISWSLLTWHEKPLHTFQNENEVSAVIASDTTESGNYILPGGSSQEGMTSEQKKTAQTVLTEKMQKGPVMFAAIRRAGFGSYAQGLICQLLIQMAGALLLTWLVLQATGLSYGKRVAFLAVVGLSAGVIADLPNWNWWGFSTTYTIASVTDYMLTWLLAGLVIAKVTKPRPA